MFNKIGEVRFSKALVAMIAVLAVMVAFAFVSQAVAAIDAATASAAAEEMAQKTRVSAVSEVNDRMPSKAELKQMKLEQAEAKKAAKTEEAKALRAEAEKSAEAEAAGDEIDYDALYAQMNIVYYEPLWEDSDAEVDLEGGAEAEDFDEASGDDSYEAEAQSYDEGTSEEAEVQESDDCGAWSGKVLNASDGWTNGPSGRETFYNLPMEGVLEEMYEKGFEGEYWVNEDGCKMFGDYIMVAANLHERPLGTILETSLGTGMVCDTGIFANEDPTGVDVAVAW